MNPLIIPLIGPIMNGLVSLFTKPKEFVKESAKTKTTVAGAVIAAGTIAAPQTEEQVVTTIIGSLISLALMLYKEHKAEE